MNMRIVIHIFCLLIGCASSAKKLNRSSIGMTKAEAIQAMGTPKSTSASQGVEHLIYILDASRTDAIMPEEYFVRIVSGRVDSFGRVRDLPAGQVPR
jgi:hypothetical protein